MTAQTLGGFFRQFRKDRGITLEAATAGAGCSPAALSRFERDQNDLSVATVGRLLANLQLTAHDFLAYTRARPGAMTHEALAAFIAGDVAALTAQQAAFAKTHPRLETPAAAYTALVYRLALAPAEQPVALTTAQEQLLAQFLVPGPGWHSVHTLGLAAGVRFGSFELLDALAERFINYAAGFDATNIAQSAVNASDFAWLALPLLATRHPQAQPVVAAMTRYHRLRRDLRQVGVIGVSVLNSAPIVTAVQTMAAAVAAAGSADAAAIASGTATVGTAADASAIATGTGAAASTIAATTATDTIAATAALAPQLEDLRLLTATALADYLEAAQARVLAGTPRWHDRGLAVHAVPPVAPPAAWAFTGATIGWLRRRYHLSLDDVAVAWSPATQSRFENGKTQLGFRDACALADALLLQVKIFYANLFPLPYTDLDARLAAVDAEDDGPQFLAAVAAATAQLPAGGSPRTTLAGAAFRGRTRLAMEGRGIAEDRCERFFPRGQIAASALQALAAMPRGQVSDMIALLDCLTWFNAAEVMTAWRWLFARATFEPGRFSAATDAAMQTMSALAKAADVPNIKSLREAAANLTPDCIWVAYSVAFASLDLTARLYLAPADQQATAATIARCDRTIHGYLDEPASNLSFLCNMFAVSAVDEVPAAAKWLAAQGEAAK